MWHGNGLSQKLRSGECVVHRAIMLTKYVNPCESVITTQISSKVVSFSHSRNRTHATCNRTANACPWQLPENYLDLTKFHADLKNAVHHGKMCILKAIFHGFMSEFGTCSVISMRVALRLQNNLNDLRNYSLIFCRIWRKIQFNPFWIIVIQTNQFNSTHWFDPFHKYGKHW